MFIVLSLNCWSAVAKKTSDRYSSLSVCPCCLQDVRMYRGKRRLEPVSLLSSASVHSWLDKWRNVQLKKKNKKCTTGGRLYGHHSPMSSYSLALRNLTPQHMAMLLLLPIWGVIQMTAPYCAKSLCHWPLSLALRRLNEDPTLYLHWTMQRRHNAVPLMLF